MFSSNLLYSDLFSALLLYMIRKIEIDNRIALLSEWKKCNCDECWNEWCVCIVWFSVRVTSFWGRSTVRNHSIPTLPLFVSLPTVSETRLCVHIMVLLHALLFPCTIAINRCILRDTCTVYVFSTSYQFVASV